MDDSLTISFGIRQLGKVGHIKPKIKRTLPPPQIPTNQKKKKKEN